MTMILKAMDGGLKVIHDVDGYYLAAFCNGVVVRTKDGGERYYTNYKIMEVEK